MKADIHPKKHKVTVTCSCGNSFEINSTYEKDKLFIEICDKCHPYYTGEHKIVDTRGRVEKFEQRYGGLKGKAAKKTAAKEAEVQGGEAKEAHKAAHHKAAHHKAEAKEEHHKEAHHKAEAKEEKKPAAKKKAKAEK